MKTLAGTCFCLDYNSHLVGRLRMSDRQPSVSVPATLGHPRGLVVIRPTPRNRFVGLVVKASASRAEDPGFESRLRRDFFQVESYQ